MPRIQPDRPALEAAYARVQHRPLTLDQMLADPTQKIIIENEARQHLTRRIFFDAQKARCGEKD